MVADCHTGSIYSPSRQKEPEAEEQYKLRAPMDLNATDLLDIKGTHYQVVLDVYTGFLWYKKFGKVPNTGWSHPPSMSSSWCGAIPAISGATAGSITVLNSNGSVRICT